MTIGTSSGDKLLTVCSFGNDDNGAFCMVVSLVLENIRPKDEDLDLGFPKVDPAPLSLLIVLELSENKFLGGAKNSPLETVGDGGSLPEKIRLIVLIFRLLSSTSIQKFGAPER